MALEDIINHIKARQRSYLDSTDKPDVVESVVYELEQVKKLLEEHK